MGSCLAGRTFVHFCHSPTLWGLVLFGRPDREDAAALARSLSLELEDGVAPHACYVDARHLSGADPDAFGELVTVYRRGLTRAAAVYTRLALVIPTGVEGAIVAGFYGELGPPFPLHVSADASAALAWLAAPGALDDQLMAILSDRLGAPPIVTNLKRLILAEDTASPEQLARALGMSQRTLQRRLRDAGTSLERETSRARVEAAKKRLIETDTPITTIALDLGFATSQHFSRQFRALVGVTPSEWRARR